MKEPDKQKINLNMSVLTLKNIDAYAIRTGLTRTAIINLAVAKFLESEEIKTKA